MEFSDVVGRRHSYRDFLNESVPRVVLERALEAAMLAPSAMNSQPWRFYVATGESRQEVGKVISQSTVHLTEYMDVLGPKRYADAVKWYSSLGEAPVVIGVTMPDTDEEFSLLNTYLSIGCAIENLLLALTDLGLGACSITFSYWVRDELAAALQVRAGETVVACIAVGYPSATPPAAPAHDTDVATFLE